MSCKGICHRYCASGSITGGWYAHDKLKEIPEIASLYEKYGDYNMTVGEVSNSKYKPNFLIDHENKQVNHIAKFYDGEFIGFTYVCMEDGKVIIHQEGIPNDKPCLK